MIALLCAAAAVQQSVPRGPVDFGADEALMEPRERRTILDGNVRLTRGDLIVTGAHAVAEFAPGAQQPEAPPPARRGGKAQRKLPQPKPGVAGQKLQRFTIEGNVHVQRGGRTADGEHGVVDMESETLVLTGRPDAQPVLRDGSETLTGERILLHLDSDDVDVTRPRLVLRRSLPAEGSQTKAVPVRVEAVRLVLDQARHLARFSDEVVVRRGDATVRSPRMDARYDPTGQLTRLELRGGVDLRQGDRRATGDKADYDAQTRQVVLTGDPRLYDRGDVLSGDRIGLALDSHEVRIDKARGRVRPEIHQGEVKP